MDKENYLLNFVMRNFKEDLYPTSEALKFEINFNNAPVNT